MSNPINDTRKPTIEVSPAHAPGKSPVSQALNVSLQNQNTMWSMTLSVFPPTYSLSNEEKQKAEKLRKKHGI